MRFEVRVYSDGQITSVFVEAMNQTDAWQQVAAQALRPLSAHAVQNPLSAWLGSKTQRFDLLLLSQELLALLEAGLNVIEVVDTLCERERHDGVRSVLDQVACRLREGHSFSGALDSLPDVFPALFVGIVRSSERTGDVQEALQRFIDYRKRLDNLRNKVISAAIYPALLGVVGLAVALFLGVYVIPRFAVVYQGSGRSLPMASALLMQWGSFAHAHLGTLLIGLVGLLVLMGVGWRNMAARGGPVILLRKLPVIKERIRLYELARLYLVLGMLLDSGLPIVQALSLAEASVPLDQRQALREAAGHIRDGERLSTVFENYGLTSTVGLRLLRVGEESGRLGDMMTRAARFHDEETGRWIERFSRMAEPLLMVAIGLVIGTIVVLLYMPIFDLAGSLR